VINNWKSGFVIMVISFDGCVIHKDEVLSMDKDMQQLMADKIQAYASFLEFSGTLGVLWYYPCGSTIDLDP
jgi:hypothetical protein